MERKLKKSVIIKGMCSKWRLALFYLIFVAAAVGELTAQSSAIIDVGSFSISRNGVRVGREQFSIRAVQTPEGRVTELRAEAATGIRRVAYRLEIDSAGQPLRYTVELRNGADVETRLGGQRVRGRFTTLSRSPAGEAAREYRLLDGVRVLDDGAIHQYAALLEPLKGFSPGQVVDLPLIVPLENRQTTIRVLLESLEDAVTVSGSRRPASRWRVTVAEGEPFHVWTDSEGRLLRIASTSSGFDALRDDVPG